MMTVNAVDAFEDNYIWMVYRDDTDSVVIVDPGDAIPVLAWLDAQGRTPAAILITHHHRDHTGGVSALRQRYDIPVYGPALESIDVVTHPLDGETVVELSDAGLRFEVLTVPGHTRGHIAYLSEDRLFCGDTLFTAGCGRLFEGTPAQMYRSLKKIAALPANTLIYCAHEYTGENLQFAQVVEPNNNEIRDRANETRRLRQMGQRTVPSELSTELKTNPFLRYNVAEVKAAAAAFSRQQLDSEAAVFASLRYWKDTLD